MTNLYEAIKALHADGWGVAFDRSGNPALTMLVTLTREDSSQYSYSHAVADGEAALIASLEKNKRPKPA